MTKKRFVDMTDRKDKSALPELILGFPFVFILFFGPVLGGLLISLSHTVAFVIFGLWFLETLLLAYFGGYGKAYRDLERPKTEPATIEILNNWVSHIAHSLTVLFVVFLFVYCATVGFPWFVLYHLGKFHGRASYWKKQRKLDQ